MFNNLEASSDGTYYYYVLGKDNFTSGNYKYCYDCGNAVEKETGCLDFEVTYTGDKLSLENTIVYSLSLIFLVFLFFMSIMFISKLPSSDSYDEEGAILQVSNLKHFRNVMWAVAWGLLLGMVFIMSNITLAYLPTAMIGDLFFKIFSIMFWMTMVVLPLWIIYIFVGIFKDKEFKRMIERGVDTRGL